MRGKSQLQQTEKIQLKSEPDSGKCQAAPQTQLQASFFFFFSFLLGFLSYRKVSLKFFLLRTTEKNPS